MCAIRYLGFLFQKAPAGVVVEPQEVTVLIGHLSWDADLVAVEVVGLLVAFSGFVDPLVYLCQRFVHTAHALRWDWRFCEGTGLLITLI